MNQLCVWGDSIARGLMYDGARGRYAVCANTFDRLLKRLGEGVKNYAKPGCTSEAGAKIFEECEKIPNAVAALEFGGNDSDLIWAEVAREPERAHEAVVSPQAYQAALARMARRAKDGGMRPVIVTPLPVVAERYFKWVSRGLDEGAILRYLGGAQYIYRWQERYAYAAMRAARDADCPVFDLRSVFLLQKNFENLMCPDGIHPNESGYALIQSAVLDAWNALREKTGQTPLPMQA